ncbi:hypothetical protein [Prauserella marina]|uniref:hypothetical protein n=1 Tax=Prauserella marina TaxID=530584 RepID=UPI003B8479B2
MELLDAADADPSLHGSNRSFVTIRWLTKTNDWAGWQSMCSMASTALILTPEDDAYGLVIATTTGAVAYPEVAGSLLAWARPDATPPRNPAEFGFNG